jgi:nucleosome binding factor SPN SPT16 subunit
VFESGVNEDGLKHSYGGYEIHQVGLRHRAPICAKFFSDMEVLPIEPSSKQLRFLVQFHLPSPVQESHGMRKNCPQL